MRRLRNFSILAVLLMTPYALALALGLDDGVAAVVGGESNQTLASLGILFVAVRLLSAAIVPSVLFGVAAVYGLEGALAKRHSFQVKSQALLSLPP